MARLPIEIAVGPGRAAETETKTNAKPSVAASVVLEEQEEIQNAGTPSSQDTIIRDIELRLGGLERHVQESAAVFERDRQSPPASTAAATDGSEHALLSELEVTLIGGTALAVRTEDDASAAAAAVSESKGADDSIVEVVVGEDMEDSGEMVTADVFESAKARTNSVPPPMPRKDPAPAPIPMSPSKQDCDAMAAAPAANKQARETW